MWVDEVLAVGLAAAAVLSIVRAQVVVGSLVRCYCSAGEAGADHTAAVVKVVSVPEPDQTVDFHTGAAAAIVLVASTDTSVEVAANTADVMVATGTAAMAATSTDAAVATGTAAVAARGTVVVALAARANAAGID